MWNQFPKAQDKSGTILIPTDHPIYCIIVMWAWEASEDVSIAIINGDWKTLNAAFTRKFPIKNIIKYFTLNAPRSLPKIKITKLM